MTKKLCLGYLEAHEYEYVKGVFPEIKFSIKVTRFVYVEDIITKVTLEQIDKLSEMFTVCITGDMLTLNKFEI